MAGCCRQPAWRAMTAGVDVSVGSWESRRGRRRLTVGENLCFPLGAHAGYASVVVRRVHGIGRLAVRVGGHVLLVGDAVDERVPQGPAGHCCAAGR